ncbi:MAG: transketolase, partial [Oscillospiraceae bacterium]
DIQCARWESFGWNVISSQGNTIDSLLEAFAAAKTEREKPTVIIANTIKGFPISFMENKAEWHHKVPTPQEQKLAFVELSKMEESYE